MMVANPLLFVTVKTNANYRKRARSHQRGQKKTAVETEHVAVKPLHYFQLIVKFSVVLHLILPRT